MILIFSSFPNVALADQPTANERKAPCRLQIGVAHLSTDLFEKLRVRAVKVNASSICQVPQSEVTITVEIWKTGMLHDHLVWQKTIKSPGTTYPGTRVDNFSTFRKCRNQTPSNYYGVSYSKALIGGKWQYARHTLSQKTSLLKCGT
jgi:hypothetical protein